MTLSIWLDSPSNKYCEKVDIAIIGGGIIGTGCAYFLAKEKNLKTVLIESRELASGASGRNAGFILRGISSYYNQTIKQYGRETAKKLFQLTEENQNFIADFASSVDGNKNLSFDYNQCGSYLLACSIDELTELAESAELMIEDGFKVDFLKHDPIERDFYGALYNPSDAGVHPAKLVQSLAAVSNIPVLSEEPVNKIDSNNNHIEIHTAKRIIACEKVLLCTNAYSPLLDSWFLDKVNPVRGQILVTQPLKKRVLDHICYANYGYEYFRQLPDNRFLLGGCRELFSDQEVGYADVATKEVQDSLEHYLKHRFPDVAGIPIDYRWSGTMGFTESGLPFIGKHPKHNGLYCAVGFNGHGFGYGLAASKMLVDLALEKRQEDNNIFALDSLNVKSKAN